jgi:8-oxo-dGTP pyrophosphatase MutT (NUDIX family)
MGILQGRKCPAGRLHAGRGGQAAATVASASPRWQVMHGRAEAAEESISFMEREVEERTGRALPPVDESKAIDVKAGEDHGYLTLLRVLFREYPTRSVLGATMMITQSFLYNAIFFTATLVLGKFYGVASEDTPLYLIAFAIGNLIGPLVLGTSSTPSGAGR